MYDHAKQGTNLRSIGKLVHTVIMVILSAVFILWPFLSYEDVKTCRYISFTKNAENFTSNNFLKCAEMKELKGVILFSYEHEKTMD